MLDQDHVKSLRHKHGKATSDKKRAIEVRKEFRRLAASKFPSEGERLKEYIEEAEHGDGLGYWLEYGPADKLLKDFRIFLRELKGLP